MTELAKQFEGAGVAAIIYTDIDRDGILTGINWEGTIALSKPFLSGDCIRRTGIARRHSPHAAADAKKLAGAITGRALYDGRIDAAEALNLIAGGAMTGKVMLITGGGSRGIGAATARLAASAATVSS